MPRASLARLAFAFAHGAGLALGLSAALAQTAAPPAPAAAPQPAAPQPAPPPDPAQDPVTEAALQLLGESGLIARQAEISQSMILMERQIRQAELIKQLLEIYGPDAPIEVAPGEFRSFADTPAGLSQRIAQIELEKQLAAAESEAEWATEELQSEIAYRLLMVELERLRAEEAELNGLAQGGTAGASGRMGPTGAPAPDSTDLAGLAPPPPPPPQPEPEPEPEPLPPRSDGSDLSGFLGLAGSAIERLAEQAARSSATVPPPGLSQPDVAQPPVPDLGENAPRAILALREVSGLNGAFAAVISVNEQLVRVVSGDVLPGDIRIVEVGPNFVQIERGGEPTRLIVQ